MSQVKVVSPIPKPTAEQMAALRRAQAIARKYIPEGLSLADELMRERRAEAANE
ncbi:MAG TPA: hypothetical protein VJQ83_13880 [Tepidiformaceae bacterium]|nr:hypothetical protein [Tepidiformaceae bacterium]